MSESFPRAVFLHSMWRTGSSYLLSRFAAEPRYLAFYEPFNGEIGSRRLRVRAARESAERHVRLRHPGSGDGGYFGLYDAADPLTGRPLWSFAHPRLALHDPYNGLSEAGRSLLQACGRLAASRGQVPVFGFCHSGVQVEAMQDAFGGEHVYLFRDPLDQFVSYQAGRNDFFAPATLVQLLASRTWAPAAVQLVPRLAHLANGATSLVAARAPHWATMNLARRVAAPLTIADHYRLFLLSWHVSNGAPRTRCDESVSLHGLQGDEAQRADFEARHGVRLADLQYPASAHALFDGFDRAACEAEVQAVVRQTLGNRGRCMPNAA